MPITDTNLRTSEIVEGKALPYVFNFENMVEYIPAIYYDKNPDELIIVWYEESDIIKMLTAGKMIEKWKLFNEKLYIYFVNNKKYGRYIFDGETLVADPEEIITGFSWTAPKRAYGCCMIMNHEKKNIGYAFVTGPVIQMLPIVQAAVTYLLSPAEIDTEMDGGNEWQGMEINPEGLEIACRLVNIRIKVGTVPKHLIAKDWEKLAENLKLYPKLFLKKNAFIPAAKFREIIDSASPKIYENLEEERWEVVVENESVPFDFRERAIPLLPPLVIPAGMAIDLKNNTLDISELESGNWISSAHPYVVIFDREEYPGLQNLILVNGFLHLYVTGGKDEMTLLKFCKISGIPESQCFVAMHGKAVQ